MHKALMVQQDCTTLLKDIINGGGYINAVINMYGSVLSANSSHQRNFVMLIYTSLYHNFLCSSLVWIY